MTIDQFCCPLTGRPLKWSSDQILSEGGGHTFTIEDGIPDFYIEDESSRVPDDDANRKWLKHEAMVGREMAYLRHREWRGVTYLIQRVAQVSRPGFRILEIGAGTGHFTQWLAESCNPGTSIFSFDFSWRALFQIQTRVAALDSVYVFRANGRGPMPFSDGCFDAIVQRLAPFSPKGVSQREKDARILQYLRPGGWHFFGAWEDSFGLTVESMLEGGFTETEYHRWAYQYEYDNEEIIGAHMEDGASRDESEEIVQRIRREGGLRKIRQECLFIGRKPQGPTTHDQPMQTPTL